MMFSGFLHVFVKELSSYAVFKGNGGTGMGVDYELLCEQMKALADGVEYEVTNLSNASALLYDALRDLNWAGFYLYRDGALILGPFQGKPACTKIAMGKGVCGTAAAEGRTLVVPDVHEFPGHIACDCASNSEIVVPLYRDGKLFGVLDIDSPRLDRFSKEDVDGLTQFGRTVEDFL